MQHNHIPKVSIGMPEGNGTLKPLITTVIPTYRRPKLLRRAIDSVLDQTYPHFQVCVYDNASGDETAEVVAEYIQDDDRVSYIKHKKNIGACNNMIKGVESVNTDYYSLLNDDDFLLPDFYRNAMQAFERSPEAEFICSKTISADTINKKWNFRNKDWLPGFYRPSNIIASKMYYSHFTLTGVLWKTTSRQSLGVFGKNRDDRLYLTMAAASLPFVVIDDFGAVYTIHPQAFSMTTGLSGQNITILKEALLSTVEDIMQFELPSENKVHLLMLVLKSYAEIFDYKKFNYLYLGTHGKGESELMLIPSLVTSGGVLAKIWEKAPVKAHPLMKHCFNLTRRIKRLMNRTEFDAEWLDIPEDAYSIFFDEYRTIKTLEEMVKDVKGSVSKGITNLRH